MKKLVNFFKRKEEPRRDSPSIPLHQDKEPTRTLILLGTGGSGKSSMLRACTPVEKIEPSQHLENIYERVLKFAIWYWEQDDHYGLTKKENDLFFQNHISKLPIDCSPFTPLWSEEFGRSLYKLYWDSGFQNEMYKIRDRTSFGESVQHFMRKKNFKRLLFKEEFKPNREDFFFASFKTTGLVQFEYRDGLIVVDTGGQRNERIKWSRILEGYEDKAVAFVISLSEFDELCYEDDVTNRYNESLLSFIKWYEHESIANSPIYLIFSKYEVLEEKVRNGVKFSQFVPEYTADDSNVESVLEFIVNKYLEVDGEKKRIVKWFNISASHYNEVTSVLDEIFNSTEGNSIQTKAIIGQPVKKKEAVKMKEMKKLKTVLIDDIVINVLKFMSQEELIETYMHVSKNWCEMASKLPINLFRPNLELFVNNSRFENVRILNLQSIFLQRKHIETLAHHSKFKKLEYLNVSNNYSLSMSDWNYLFENNKFEHLTVIAMDYCNLSSFDFLHGLPKLKIASLKGNAIESSQVNTPFKIESNLEDSLLEL